MFNLLLSKGVWTNTSFVRGWLGPALWFDSPMFGDWRWQCAEHIWLFRVFIHLIWYKSLTLWDISLEWLLFINRMALKSSSDFWPVVDTWKQKEVVLEEQIRKYGEVFVRFGTAYTRSRNRSPSSSSRLLARMAFIFCEMNSPAKDRCWKEEQKHYCPNTYSRTLT
jgi:hypothetical protein